MNIQTCAVNFSSRTTALPLRKGRQCSRGLFHRLHLGSDTFTQTSFDVNKDLKKVRLKEKINEGRTSEVYTTNFSEYVVRITRGMAFAPKALTAIDDPNGLTVAEDQYGFTKLMKHIKGEPLYGKGWIIYKARPVKQYMNTFEKILDLPDETFAQYIRDVINIRKKGYDIDEINPNNFLLDGKQIRIVDLEEKPNIEPQILLRDFDPFVDKYHLIRMFQKMNLEDIQAFAEKIKYFYNRIMRIAEQEGHSLSIEEPKDDGFAKKRHLINYLYYRDWDMIKRLTKM